MEIRSNVKSPNQEVDLYRDTSVRLLGYANEVGESFRALVNVWVVRFSYVLASAYVVADTVDKSVKASKHDWPSKDIRRKAVTAAATDSLVWQSLASVVIPGFTINRVCALSLYTLARVTQWPSPVRKWTTTAIGLGCIPFIVHPIDQSVHFMMDKTIRPWLRTYQPNQAIHKE